MQTDDRDASASTFVPEWCQTDSPLRTPEHDFVRTVSCACAFPPEFFESVMMNLIFNPNITSSYLFRADIFYDSDKDASYDPENQEEISSFVKHMKDAYRPWMLALPGYKTTRTMVRNLVPRNPQLDRHLLQTCHILQSEKSAKDVLIVYVPHIERSEDMPFYHPQVRALAFHYTSNDCAVPDSDEHDAAAATAASPHLTLHVELFPANGAAEEQLEKSTRLSRTLLKLLQVIHKHSMGRVRGYQKRVHHDQIVPQRRFQDTYTRLKGKYAKDLVNNWQEVTDPSKHVFEDLGIAAFLIELWQDIFTAKDLPFPGFVDIGCGNGILTYVLIMEGYEGFGFDARRRKSWSSFPERVECQLSEAVLVPQVLQRALAESATGAEDWMSLQSTLKFHDGAFKSGTFVISNHADELTAWTPLLSCVSRSPFLAIPCCSHNLAGERFRAPLKAQREVHVRSSAMTAQHVQDSGAAAQDGKGERTGSLKQPNAKSMPSQYAALCAYVAFLATGVGYQAEKEILRIPSTRNTAVIGRHGSCMDANLNSDEAEGRMLRILEEELDSSIQQCAKAWLARATRIVSSKGTSH